MCLDGSLSPLATNSFSSSSSSFALHRESNLDSTACCMSVGEGGCILFLGLTGIISGGDDGDHGGDHLEEEEDVRGVDLRG